MTEMEWHVYADESRSVSVAHGAIPTQWLGANDDEKTGEARGARVGTLHPEVIPEIRREARKVLLVKEPAHANEASFPVPKAVLGGAGVANDRAGDSFHCVVKLDGGPASNGVVENEPYSSWFDAKLRRAALHRQRGNDRFKEDKLKAAVRAYETALQWLACPTSQCHFSAEELEKVNAVAIPCHTNLATCHWKLGRMDACINHSAQALALDPQHTKARYRRSQAYVQTKQFDEAVQDLEAAVLSDPESKLFRSGLDRAKLTRQQHRNRQKQALAAAFTQK